MECEESATGSKITREGLDAAHEWYCSQVSGISDMWRSRTAHLKCAALWHCRRPAQPPGDAPSTEASVFINNIVQCRMYSSGVCRSAASLLSRWWPHPKLAGSPLGATPPTPQNSSSMMLATRVSSCSGDSDAWRLDA